jgi:hypothetical protein
MIFGLFLLVVATIAVEVSNSPRQRAVLAGVLARFFGSQAFYRWAAWMRRRGSYRMIVRKYPDGRREDYLERFHLISLGGWALFLHCFWADDQDGFHDHPWPSASFILTGGYYEDGPGRLEPVWRQPFSVRFMTSENLHRVFLRPEHVGATWTLFAHARRCRPWGFLDPQTGKWRAASETGNQEKRGMRGILFPRYTR